MTDRLNKIFACIPNCSVFADVGCDHGYIAEAMISSGKCEKAIISDISKKCLIKAEKLLKDYIADGSVISVVSDGFKNLPSCDCALIAGMGGEEIVSILEADKAKLPKNLILQPMRNCDKVRLRAVAYGYKIIKDFVFKSANNFYDLITLLKGSDSLSKEEVEFGRTNLIERPLAFTQRLNERIEKLKVFSNHSGISEKNLQEMKNEIERLKKYV